MLRARVISALVLGIPALLAAIAGGWWYALVVMLVIGVAAVEFTNLVARQGHRVYGGLLLVWIGFFLVDRIILASSLIGPGIALPLLCAIFWMLVRYSQGTANAVTGFAFTTMAALFLGWGGAHFLGLRALENGVFWMLAVILAVWCTDTASYFVGSVVGRTPMLPAISPGKTWEGYWGGFLGGLFGVAVFVGVWRAIGLSLEVDTFHVLVIGLIAAIIGPLGDFAVSALKRYVGVKNASRLIPGHGGMLDRIDTLIVTGWVSYYYLTLVMLVRGGP
jgi:phosphatidate cytidylyltransferase